MNDANEIKESKIFQGIYPKGFMPYRIKWFDLIIASVITLIVLIVYIRTMAPGVIAGDSGELTTEIYQMGACHPPGYPLYGILGKVFTFIPLGDIAHRVNLYVAFSGAFAIFMLYLVLVKLLGFNRDKGKISLSVHLPAVAAAFIFAFSYDFWQQSSASGKFYSLNVLLVAAMLFVMVLWYEEMMYFRNEAKIHFAERMTILLGFIMGLSLTDHMLPLWFIAAFFIVMLPFTIFIIVQDGTKQFKKEFAARIPGLIILGILFITSIILLYVYLFAIRLIYPLHLPLILIGIFLVPAYITLYTVLVKVKKSFGISTAGVVYGISVVIGIAAFIAFSIFVNNNQTVPQTNQYLFGFTTADNTGLQQGMMQQTQIDPIIIILAALAIVVVFFFGIFDSVIKKSEVDYGLADKMIEILTYSGWMFIFAMTLYLYLMVRAVALAPLPDPKPLSWGDTQTLDILFNHMFRKQYGGGGGNEYINLGGQILTMFNVTVNQFDWPGIVFALAGLIFFFIRDKIWTIYTIAAFVISYLMLIKFINFQVDPFTVATQKQYFSQLHMIVAIYIGFGFQLLLELTQNKFDLKKMLSKG